MIVAEGKTKIRNISDNITILSKIPSAKPAILSYIIQLLLLLQVCGLLGLLEHAFQLAFKDLGLFKKGLVIYIKTQILIQRFDDHGRGLAVWQLRMSLCK